MRTLVLSMAMGMLIVSAAAASDAGDNIPAACKEVQTCGAPDCCAHCGCHACCEKYCRVVCEMKEVKKTVWVVKCEDFCTHCPVAHCNAMNVASLAIKKAAKQQIVKVATNAAIPVPALKIAAMFLPSAVRCGRRKFWRKKRSSARFPRTNAWWYMPVQTAARRPAKKKPKPETRLLRPRLRRRKPPISRRSRRLSAPLICGDCDARKGLIRHLTFPHQEH